VEERTERDSAFHMDAVADWKDHSPIVCMEHLCSAITFSIDMLYQRDTAGKSMENESRTTKEKMQKL